MIRKLSERQHILMRPSMYIGAVDLTRTEDFILNDGKITYHELEYVPGLIKIINEIIDNSVDEAIKTNFEFSAKIDIAISDTLVTVKDNGRGIPVKKNADGHYLPELCWAHARAGSNFDDDENRTQIGLNGIGSFATACFSKTFVGQTDDGENAYEIQIVDNAESFTEKLYKTRQRGTQVTFAPDLERFGLTEINETHINVIKQRLINLSLTFPEITFKLNGKKIVAGSFKKFAALFNPEFETYETENYQFAFLPNADDDFRHYTFVNGLKIPDGGTHVDLITWNVVQKIKDKLAKKYKTIKPADIKNKLMLVMFAKNMKNTKFNSQSKEKITNSEAEMKAFLGEINYDSLVYKMLRNPKIMDPIVEVYKLKEELKRRLELKELDKPVKKIKSDKYLPSIGERKYLVLTEGESALGGLSPVLGRKEFGYYTLRGVPLNAYSSPQEKFKANKELSELYKVIQNEGYENIVIASDQDLDGTHIRGLLMGFFLRYLPNMIGKVAILQTPVIGVKKGKELTNWYYSLSDEVTIARGEVSKYYKGLGSWGCDDLKQVVAKDGLDKMIDFMDFNNTDILDDWLNGDKADVRKGYIQANEFNIAKI